MNADKGGSWKGGGGKGRPRRQRETAPADAPAPRTPQPAADRKGWRRKGQVEQASERDWSRDRKKGVWSDSFSLRMWLFAGLTLVAAMVGYWIYTILTQPHTVPFVAIAVTQYDSLAAPNSFAVEDLERFISTYQGYDNITAQRAYKDITDKQRFLEELSRMLSSPEGKPNGPDRNSVIIYISAHGVVDGQGNACLLFGDALNSDQWLRVSELFTAVDEVKQSEGANKLIVFDSGRIQSNWRIGTLYNSFADRLQHALTTHGNSRIAILNSTQAGQRGWSAAEVGGSVFGYFVAAGLRGAADVNPQDGLVSLEELGNYVARKVDDVATKQRGHRQQPILVLMDPSQREFEIAHASGTTQLAKKPVDVAPRYREISDRWTRRQELYDAAVYKSDPISWAELEWNLLRLEALAAGGVAYDSAYATLLADVDNRLSLIGASTSALDSPWLNLPALRAQYGIDDAEFAQSQADYATWKAAQSNPDPAAKAAAPTFTYVRAAPIAYDLLTNGPSAQIGDRMQTSFEFLDQSIQRFDLEPVEIQFARMAQRYLIWEDAGSDLQMAIEVRAAAERAAHAIDVRAHYGVRTVLSPAERELRIAEDRLFAATPDDLRQARLTWNSLGTGSGGGTLAEAMDVQRLLVEALAVRDRAWAELPFLASWIVARWRIEQQTTRQGELDELIAATHELGRALDRLPTDRLGIADTGSIDQLTQKVTSLSTRIREQIGTLTREVVQERSSLTEDTQRDIGDVLAVPLVEADDRRDLLSNYPKPLGDGPWSTAAPTDSSTGTQQADDKFIERQVTWKQHAAVAMLDLKALDLPIELVQEQSPIVALEGADRAASLAHLAKLGERIRQRLLDINTMRVALDRLSVQRRQASAPQSDVRRPLSQADRLTRAGISYVGRRGWTLPESDPSRVLAALDDHFYMLWQCQRRIDDFWGPMNDGGEDYYAASARKCLTAASRAFPDSNQYSRQWDSKLSASMRPAGSRFELTLKPPSLRLPPDGETVQNELTVHTPAPLPAGVSTVYVRLPGADGDPLTILDEVLQPLGQRSFDNASLESNLALSQAYKSDSTMRARTSLEAFAFFRGHTRVKRFPVGEEPTGDVVVFVRPNYSDPTVIVKGDAAQVTQLLFILDCSASMNTKVSTIEGERTRLQIAKARLLNLIKELVELEKDKGVRGSEGSFHVGLMLYGHRSTYRSQRAGSYIDTITQKKYFRPSSDGRFFVRNFSATDISPSRDAEVVLPVQPLVLRRIRLEDLYSEFEYILREPPVDPPDADDNWLFPIGETPLYLSLKNALGAFPNDVDFPRHIVAITDGYNFQNYPDTTSGKILEMLDDPSHRDTRIDILLFGKEREDATQIKQLNDITRKAHGEFHPEVAADELLDILKSTLQRVKYAVQPLGSPAITAADKDQLHELDTPWASGHQPGRYVARLIGTEEPVESSFELRGGEQLELGFNKASNRLEHERFIREAGLSREENVKDPLSSTRRFYLQTHMPRRTPTGGAIFRVSIQNQIEADFSPRPRHLWAEIRPRFANPPATVPVYRFFDLEFEDRVPVPVLNLRVDQWPDAAEADVLLWFTVEDVVPPTRVFTITKTEDSFRMPNQIPDVLFSVRVHPAAPGEKTVVEVIETHESGGDLGVARVEMFPLASRISHSYIEESRKVRHTFEFNQLGPTDKPLVQVTPKSAIIKQSVAAPSLGVRVPQY